jgi:hypothetical protein
MILGMMVTAIILAKRKGTPAPATTMKTTTIVTAQKKNADGTSIM